MSGGGARLTGLISRAKNVLLAGMQQYRRPCVLWSGGKDSMVLLHMLRDLYGDLPVVCYREPWMPEKQAFVNRVISEWGLTVWDYAPSAVALCKGNGRIDVIQHYQIGQTAMMLARGTEPLDEVAADGPTLGCGSTWLCGRDTFLSRPLGTFNFPWDAMFIGHKSSDVDPTSGGVPLAVDVMDTPGTAAAVYPLREWTDEDVFAYIERYGVPYDESRYLQLGPGDWTLSEDITANPDYYRTCLACCDPDAAPFVRCPKTGLEINNVSARVPFIEPSLPYCGLREGADV